MHLHPCQPLALHTVSSYSPLPPFLSLPSLPFPDEDISDLPLLNLTEEDMLGMTESLQDAKIDYNQLELTDTLGEGERYL